MVGWCVVFVCGSIKKNGGGGFVLGACFTPHEQENDGENFGGGGVAWKVAVVVLLWVAAGGDQKRGEGESYW